jgi:hypothetical protein
MENNLDNLQEDEVIIEDIDVDALETLDETLEQDITEAKVNPKEIDGEDDDDKEDDGEGLDDLGDEDSDVDNDGDSDEADEYLTKRRKTVAKKIAKEDTDMNEDLQLDEADDSNKIIKVEIPYLSDEDNDRDIEMHKVTKKAKASADKNGFKVIKVDDDGEEIYVTFSGPKSKLLTFVRRHMGPSNKNDTDEELLDTFGESFESEDITRLIESEEGLTEEFKDKAAIIFEAAVSSKVNEIEATLVEQYESRLAEQV